MAKKKPARKKKSVSKRKTVLKKKVVVRKKPAAKKKAAPKKKAATTKKAAKKKAPAKKKAVRRSASSRQSGREFANPATPKGRGLGSAAAGQSGDTQGLSRREFDDSESVEELMEEGQYAEAEAVSGVENAPDADEGEVRTHEVQEDDVPEEYLDQD